jgi:hypothetical protein
MKKLYTLLSFIFIGFVGHAQIINIPDSTFKGALINAGVDTNNDGNIQQSEALNVTSINISNTSVSDLTGIQSFTNLVYLYCERTNLYGLNVSNLTNLIKVDADFTFNLGTVNLAGCNSLKEAHFMESNLSTINATNLAALELLSCSYNNISSLNLTNCGNLKTLVCRENQLTQLNLSACPNLENLNCNTNMLSSLDLSNHANLIELDCNSNQLTTLNIANCYNLQKIFCSWNQLTTLNVQNFTNLLMLYCNRNQFTTLDLNSCTSLNTLDCGFNLLNSLFIKNGVIEGYGSYTYLSFEANPNLGFICCDESQTYVIASRATTYGYTNCAVNSYCSFSPGGVYYSIVGNSKFDLNNNGCDLLDTPFPNLKLNFSSGAISGSMFANTSGNYSMPVSDGTHTIAAVLENPTYFTVSPVSTAVTFPTQSSPYTQDFCVSANGIHNDVEALIIPLTRARAGFDARYKIVYKNKGNQTMSGTLTFGFDDDYMDFVSASSAPESINFSLLTWNYANLTPFESREIEVTLNMNTPSESLPLNIGSVIKFESTIFPLAGDETQTDNSQRLEQVVVGSFDPNDKNCLEGNIVGVEKIGEYVHYMIRFENTGNYAAENVVVKDIIDTTKFDIGTLVPLSGSHSFITKITNTNSVEFIFENINLPFDDANNDGYVVFKIKTKPTLVVGNTFSNAASIYFDYNFPIITNTAITSIQALGTQDFEFSNVFTLSPVPAKNSLTITTKQVLTISSVIIYNTLGQLVQVNTNPNEIIDVSGLKTGNYFIKIVSDKGTASSKFIKE